MEKQIEAVKNFHKTYNLTIRHVPDVSFPTKESILRYELFKEENEEYLDAVKNKDLIGVADALGDMLYILFGTILDHGLQDKIEDIFDEIHRSNMSKLDKNGQPIYREDGKVLKGPNYSPPNLESILENNEKK